MDSVNPFALGGVVRGAQFAGRAAELARLRSLARSGERLYLFAPRRYGKTSLLREALEPKAAAEAIILLWCDCLPTANAADLAARLAEPIVRAARRSRVVEWAREAAGLFTRLRPALTVGSDGEVRVSLDLAPEGEGLPGIEDALSAVGRLAAAKKKPVVVVFDEFQQIAAWDSGHRTEAIVRTAIQSQEGVAYMFAGSQRHLLQEMFGDRARPLFQLAVPFPLGRLSSEELSPWLAERFRETGLALEADADAALGVTAAGHPWATQYLAHFVWEIAAGSTQRVITGEMVRLALDEALRAGETIYAGEYSVLTPAQRQVLSAVAAEPTAQPTAAEYLAKHRLPAKSTVSQALASLVEKGQVEQHGETYWIADPLFGEWLRRQ